MRLSSLQDFCLVGGTALALKYGHRISVDLDLFCNKEFNKERIIVELTQTFGRQFLYENSKTQWAVFCYIQNVKVDLIHYKHQQIAPTEIYDKLRLYNNLDLIAMKVNAILGRGKKKDFWDIFELLHHYSLSDIIQFYYDKFPDQQLIIGIPYALTYFDDAEESEDPISLKGQTWPDVKKFIQQKVSEFLR